MDDNLNDNGGNAKNDQINLLKAYLQMSSSMQKNTDELHNLASSIQVSQSKSPSFLNQGTFLLGALVQLVIIVAFIISIRKDVDNNTDWKTKTQPIINSINTQYTSLSKDVERIKDDHSKLDKRVDNCEKDITRLMRASGAKLNEPN